VVLAAILAITVGLAGCGPNNPVSSPVDWWHHLQGGEIAASRPPPPGADLPYPHVFTIPPKPTPPTAAFRQTVQTQLTQDRDITQRLAAHTPIDLNAVPPPPPPPKPAAAAAGPGPGSDKGADDTANAILPAADAPPPSPTAPTAQTAPSPAPDGGPAPGTPVTLAGAPPDEAALPDIPAAPPPPATFETVAAQPEPSPQPPAPPSTMPPGAHRVLFATGDAKFNPSQKDVLEDIVVHRGKGVIAIEGHGEAKADTPDAQQAALDLGLKRAAAIAANLMADHHVPPDKILLGATAFGRDATVRDQ